MKPHNRFLVGVSLSLWRPAFKHRAQWIQRLSDDDSRCSGIPPFWSDQSKWHRVRVALAIVFAVATICIQRDLDVLHPLRAQG